MKHVEGKITKDTKLLGRKEILLEHMKGKTLDIGCGEGELLIKATLLGHDIIGIDHSPKEIETAKKTAVLSKTKINIKLASVEALPFEENTFDTIIMGELIEHLTNIKSTINYVLKFLKPGGQLLITTPAGFAHVDVDHINFFFTEKTYEIIEKLWVLQWMPQMICMTHNAIAIDKLLKKMGHKFSIHEFEYGDSKYKSLDYFIIIKKE
jgi:2-polyprenyl-3-methyl-5-hydroxy-6-metoxy-1,4-benzoquinol methylase